MRSLALVGVVVGAAYLIWRAGWTMSGANPWLAYPLFIAEVHGYLTFLLFVLMAWDISPPRKGQAPPDVTVDFFIPTYNEPYQVLAITIAGAVAVRGAHTTWVLDDGRRPWVKELCERLGARYLTRDDNRGAKAGNINAALKQTMGEFIAIVDADFVPAPGFLEETLGYFADPNVAIVQGPQEFYNTDSFQHAGDGSDWHEQSSFYRVIQPGKNRHNAVFWCGSPSVVRRAALEDVGGVSMATVTEDLDTSIQLHKRGWRIVFHPETIARGVAPEDYNAFITQRIRWAQGAMQVIRKEWRRPGLSLPQRINYVASTTTYFDAVRKLVLLAIVPAILFTGEMPVSAPAYQFLAAWTGFFVLTQMANVALGRGHYRWLLVEMFDLLKMFAFIRSIATLVIARAIRFRVTPKSAAGSRYLHPLAWPYVALIGVYAGALAVGALRTAGLLPNPNPLVIEAAIAWALLISVGIAAICWRTYAHVTRRGAHRVLMDIPGWMKRDGEWRPVHIQDLSLAGASFVSPLPLAAGETVVVTGPRREIGGLVTVRRVQSIPGGYLVGAEIEGDVMERTGLAPYLASALFPGEPGEPTAAEERRAA